MALNKAFKARCKQCVKTVRLMKGKLADKKVSMHTQTVEISLPEEIGIEIQVVAKELEMSASELWQYLCMSGGLAAAYHADKKPKKKEEPKGSDDSNKTEGSTDK